MKQLNSICMKSAELFRRFAPVLLLLLCAFAVNAQVTGTVLDSQNEPLAGATIAIKGTSTGTTTDVDGKFRLNAAEGAILMVSYTGYNTQTITVGAEKDLTIKLEEGASLEEVIVTGYSVDTRRQTTSAVSTVKSRDLTAIPSGNVEQQLQGRVAGLTVITNGQPGTTSQVRVRGFGAFGGNEPLYVVDGVPTGSIDFLAPDDIENTTVMKDASSASIYGARAANGVIVITTKKGAKTPQKVRITYDALYGWTDPGEGPEVLNPQEQADWTWQAIRNTAAAEGKDPVFNHPQYGQGSTPVLPEFINVGGKGGVASVTDADIRKYNVNPNNGSIFQIVRANKAGTDWYGAVTRTAPQMRHGLGFSGSGENSRFYIGMSLQDQDGILIYNSFKRYTLRINTEFDLSKRVRIGQNFQGTYLQALGQISGGSINAAQDENDILSAFRMPTIIPIYDDYGGYGGTAAPGFNNPRNPIAARDGARNNRGFTALGFGNLYAEADLMDGLTFKTSLGGNYFNFGGRFYGRRSYENSENNSSVSYGEFYGYGLNWVLTNTLNYKKEFGRHGFDILAGQEALRSGNFRGINSSGLNPFSEDPNYITLRNVSNVVSTSDNGTPVSFASYFGRVKYSLNDKYYVTGVIRRDGSSRFGANARYGVFPAFSAAWRVSGESFMQNVSWLEDFKIRGGWGQMGNSNNVDPANQFSLFAASLGEAAYSINGSPTSVAEGFFQSRVGNPNAQWEVSNTSNVGFEGLIMNGKLDVVVDLWRKNTDRLLYRLPIAQVLGSFAQAPSQNISSMLNEGIDVQLINKGKVAGRVGYEVTLIGSWLRNEITKVAEGVPFFDAFPSSNRLGSTMIRNQVGNSISAFFGYEVAGLFQTKEEAAAAKQEGAGVGRFKYVDNNGFDDKGILTGKPDGKIDAADRTFIGSPVPKFTGGMNLKITVGSFDVETYLYTSLGNKIFNLSKWFTDFYPSFTGAAISTRVKDSWSPTNTGATTPIFETASNLSTNVVPNSYYVEDGSFLRMQNLSVGYNVSKAMLDKLNLRRLRLYASTNNLFTITKYLGLDPAVGGAVDTSFGIDVGNYPVTRSVVVGLGVTF
jgi:TonB-dependent starch-binding outer membrane protein SusC